MKKNLLVLTALTFGGFAFAGVPMMESKQYKGPQPVETCFAEHEFQLDIFGQYSVGEGPNQVQLFRDHGWGGGIGLNYFFTRNLGIGVDAAWLYAKEGPAANSNDDETVLHNFSGSLILRFPIDELCLAPYIYAGGGAAVDGEQWATAHGGVGVEYRFAPGKGIFVDGRWTYLGDRYGLDDLNYFSTRVGFRLTF
jgi:hypothetical protein